MEQTLRAISNETTVNPVDGLGVMEFRPLYPVLSARRPFAKPALVPNTTDVSPQTDLR